MDAIDPVTLVVVQNGLQQVASEMDLTFERAAFSPVISEGFDRSDGIYDKDSGDVIAQGELGLPIFVGLRTTEIADLDTFYYAEPYHQQYLDKNPNGYCPVHATGVSCRV